MQLSELPLCAVLAGPAVLLPSSVTQCSAQAAAVREGDEEAAGKSALPHGFFTVFCRQIQACLDQSLCSQTGVPHLSQ